MPFDGAGEILTGSDPLWGGGVGSSPGEGYRGLFEQGMLPPLM
jgi:hypothetical protein